MIPQSLIKYAVGVALTAAAAGQLPKFIGYVRIETTKLVKASQGSSWGKVWIPGTDASKDVGALRQNSEEE